MTPTRVRTIREFHDSRGLPKAEHPLISVVDVKSVTCLPDPKQGWVLDFYLISMKRGSCAKYKYGQNNYDFGEGILSFIAPNQVFSIESLADSIEMGTEPNGWILLIHPDFLWNTSLSKSIRQYGFFDYSANEALLLSEKEELKINAIIQNIQQEYHGNIDKYSKQIIITQIESLLSYSDRFYNRQFITREKAHHQILERLERLLTDYFNDDNSISKGLPTAQYISDNLNVSVSYLSRLLRVLTGQTTQQHIHDKLIEKAKEKLSTTDLTVSEIAYELGFEHSQSFSKLFKSKTYLSPLEFRQSFN